MKRVRMSRSKAWRIDNPNAVIVSRGGGRKWGNPCRNPDKEHAAASFVNWISGCKIARDIYGEPPTLKEIREALSGKDLACWCSLNEPCHADALLHLANTSNDDEANALLRMWRVFPTYTGISDNEKD